ncbi:MAG: PP2C family protein-serine/threonine phosphatase, partial [Anaeroplasmataceae bacterium]|nr:PP2C family protein-serine/threonine phosphatase [Anaeroplasmataceae bacterium]
VNPDILLSYEKDKEWLPITYIFDCFDRGEGPYPLGRQGPINPKFINEAYYVITTGNRSSDYFISHSFHGYNTSALLPVAVGDEYLILCVEIPMQFIIESIKDYLIHAVIVSVSIIVFVIILFMIYYYFVLIKPIKIMTKETRLFIDNVSHPSKALKKIKWKNDIGYLAKSILKMEQDIISYIENIRKVTKEQEKLNAELEIATQIQMSMLPNLQDISSFKEFSIAASMNPAKAVGGDFYDFFMVDENHLAIVMADVSGKGIPAALFMMIGKTLLKEYTKTNLDPASVFSKVNQILCESNKEGLFITAFEGILNLSTGDFYYVNAGHEIPFIAKNSNHFKPYPITPEFVLAGLEDTAYEAGHIVLDEGDKLFQYTDGVTEATNLNNELFGMKRLEEVLYSSQSLEPKDILQQVKLGIDDFVGQAPQFDDITMLCLEFKKKREVK